MKTDIIKKYILDNPDLTNIDIARKLVNERFANENIDVLRKLVGFIKDDGNFSEYTEFEPEMAEMPESWYSEPNRYELEGKLAIISDIHVPFHDKHALNTAVKYIEKYNPDYLLLNGDIGDFYAVSKFLRDVNLRDIAKELSMLNQFLDWIGSKFTKIIYKEGNHEERIYHSIARNNPEFGNLEGVKLENILKLKERNIQFVVNRDKIRIDKLNIIHGNEVGKGGGINVARAMLLQVMDNILFGHFHTTQEAINFRNQTSNTPISGWSVGCLCGISPEYAKFNRWNHGFALVETLEGGGFEVQNKRIINNKVM